MMKFLKHNRSRLWSVTVLLALALLVTLLAACTNTPGGTDTTTDPSATVDTPTETDSDGNPVTGEPSDTPADTGNTPDNPQNTTDPDETLGEPPVIEIPSDETKPTPSETENEEETLPYDPSLHPGDSSLYKGVLIHSVYGTGKKGAEALISNGYVQLYNKSDKDIALTGASLYYKSDGNNPFDQFVFPEGAIIPAGGYYLVRTNTPNDFNPDNAVMKIEHCDAEWDIYLDNKEIRLLLAPSGWSISRD